MTSTVDRPNRDVLNKAIDIYRDAMRSFIVRNLHSVRVQQVEEATIDVGDFSDLISRNWHNVFNHQFPNDKQIVQDTFQRIREARNRAAHPEGKFAYALPDRTSSPG